MKYIEQIVTLDGTTFTGEITENNSKGLLLKTKNRPNFNSSIFISHQAISHIEFIVEENEINNAR